MLNAMHRMKTRQGSNSEDGVVLVVTVVIMVTLLVVAAFAIDTAIWYVHGRHLQTQADGAALAGAQAFQFPCTA
ncbi:MAG TPA: pilus assembly protein TadG-related protein, partial [Caulobacteraceae bacterium]|nr:pilus assembly protein TadG-related protein [Caulobacteraceae bacterium]